MSFGYTKPAKMIVLFVRLLHEYSNSLRTFELSTYRRLAFIKSLLPLVYNRKEVNNLLSTLFLFRKSNKFVNGWNNQLMAHWRSGHIIN